MFTPCSLLRRSLCLAVASFATLLGSLHAQNAAPAASIIANSGMETDADGDHWPDGWPRLKAGGSWENEEGNRFLRMTSTVPGEMLMLYTEIRIPEGTTALELSWRQRVTGLKRGKNSWFDARIMMEFMDASRGKVSPSPKPAATGKDTDGWVTRTASFLVPEGAVFLKFMPALFNVQAGVFDLDDIVLKPVDPAAIIAKQKEREERAAKARVPVETDNKAKWPPALGAPPPARPA